MLYLKSRWALAALLTIAGLGLWVRPASAYTIYRCYGTTLYVDFYDANGGYLGYLRQPVSAFCA